MTVIIILCLVAWEVYRTARPTVAPGRGLAEALVTAVVVVLLSRAAGFNGAVPFAAWPACAAALAVLVGTWAARCVAPTRRARPREAP